jgi:hypothetical protein
MTIRSTDTIYHRALEAWPVHRRILRYHNLNTRFFVSTHFSSAQTLLRRTTPRHLHSLRMDAGLCR